MPENITNKIRNLLMRQSFIEKISLKPFRPIPFPRQNEIPTSSDSPEENEKRCCRKLHHLLETIKRI